MTINKITIVDYGVGNIHSVRSAFEYLGTTPIVTSDPQEIRDAEKLVLPGVGAFQAAMGNIHKLQISKSLKHYAQSGKALLGICVGMQLLFSHSSEGGHCVGLDLIAGSVDPLPKTNPQGVKIRVPHVGWSKVQIVESERKNDLYRDGLNDFHAYFSHSFVCRPSDPDTITSRVELEGIDFCTSVCSSSIYGIQFHPERSSEAGLDILQQFINR